MENNEDNMNIYDDVMFSQSEINNNKKITENLNKQIYKNKSLSKC